MRTVEATPRTDYSLSNAGPEVPLSELVRVRFTRHRIEEVFGVEPDGGNGLLEFVPIVVLAVAALAVRL